MESRSRTVRGPQTITYSYPGGTWGYTQENVQSAELFQVYSDQKHGDRKSPNSHSFAKRVDRPHRGGIYYTYDNGLSISNEGCLGYYAQHVPGTSYTIPPETYNQALSRFYDQVRGSFDAAIFVAEMPSTVKMIRSALSLVRFIKSFSPKNWGNKWLEYQYGWKPLVNDIYTFGDVTRRSLPSKLVVQSSASDKSIDRELNADGYWSNSRIMRVTQSSHRVRFKAHFHIAPSVLSSIGDYTSLNPLSVAWELMPYSFVVDWMVDVGGYLRNLESACISSSAFLNGVCTIGVKVETTESSKFYPISVPPGVKISCSSGASAVYTAKDRGVLSSSPTPMMPRFHANLGSQRLLSAASLLSQFLGGGGRR